MSNHQKTNYREKNSTSICVNRNPRTPFQFSLIRIGQYLKDCCRCTGLSSVSLRCTGEQKLNWSLHPKKNHQTVAISLLEENSICYWRRLHKSNEVHNTRHFNTFTIPFPIHMFKKNYLLPPPFSSLESIYPNFGILELKLKLHFINVCRRHTPTLKKSQAYNRRQLSHTMTTSLFPWLFDPR